MKLRYWISTALLCTLLTGCASGQQWWSNLKEGLSGSDEEQSSHPASAPAAQMDGSSGFYPSSMSTVFNATIRAARELGWELIYAKEEERHIYAVPLGTLFEPREDIDIHFTPTAGGVEVRAVTESGHQRRDFKRFYPLIEHHLGR